MLPFFLPGSKFVFVTLSLDILIERDKKEKKKETCSEKKARLGIVSRCWVCHSTKLKQLYALAVLFQWEHTPSNATPLPERVSKLCEGLSQHEQVQRKERSSQHQNRTSPWLNKRLERSVQPTCIYSLECSALGHWSAYISHRPLNSQERTGVDCWSITDVLWSTRRGVLMKPFRSRPGTHRQRLESYGRCLYYVVTVVPWSDCLLLSCDRQKRGQKVHRGVQESVDLCPVRNRAWDFFRFCLLVRYISRCAVSRQNQRTNEKMEQWLASWLFTPYSGRRRECRGPWL